MASRLSDLLAKKAELEQQIIEIQREERASAIAQVKALMAQRDKEIEAVLTPEQLTKVAALKKEAASKAAAGKKPAAKKTEAAAEKPVKSAGGN